MKKYKVHNEDDYLNVIYGDTELTVERSFSGKHVIDFMGAESAAMETV